MDCLLLSLETTCNADFNSAYATLPVAILAFRLSNHRNIVTGLHAAFNCLLTRYSSVFVMSKVTKQKKKRDRQTRLLPVGNGVNRLF